MNEFQHDELLIWGPLLSPSMGNTIVGDSEESAPEPTVYFNIQPATQSSGLSDVQSKEANSSNPSPGAPSDFPTVFLHEPTPSTSATAISSTGRIMKPASLSPLPSVSKQDTSRPGAANITSVCPYTVALDKK